MSISFIGPSGACEFPWIHYALLRDNILHHCEQGQITTKFSETYKISGSLAGVQTSVSAKKLREEMIFARELIHRPITELAISARTRAVLSFEQALPLGPPTQVVGPDLSLPWLSNEPQTLGQVFGDLIESLLHITEGAKDTERVDVIET